MIIEPKMSLIIHNFSNITDYFENYDTLKEDNIGMVFIDWNLRIPRTIVELSFITLDSIGN